MAVNGGQVYTQLTVDDKSFTAGMRNADKQLQGFTNTLKTAASAAAAMFAVRWGTKLMSGLIEQGKQAQLFKIQLTTALQDAELGMRRYEEAKRFAMSTPFQMDDAVEATRQLSLMNFDNIEKGMTGLGNMAMTYGKTMSELAGAMFTMNTRVMRAYGVTIKQGKEWAVEYHGKVYKPVTNDIAGLQKAFIDMANVEFAGGIEKGEKTFQGAWNQFGDQIEIIKNSINETGGVMEHLTGTMRLIKTEFSAWNQSNDALTATASLARIIKDGIDTAAGAVRLLGSGLTFVAKNADLVKTAFMGIAGAKGLNVALGVFDSLRTKITEITTKNQAAAAAEKAHAQAMRDTQAASAGLQAGLSQVELEMAIAQQEALRFNAALNGTARAQAELSAIAQGNNPFASLQMGAQGAARAMDIYASSFATVKERMAAGMGDMQQYQAALTKLAAIENEIALLRAARATMPTGDVAAIAMIESRIAALQSEGAQLEINAAAEWNNAQAKMGSNATSSARIAALAKEKAAQDAEIISIRQETGELSKHIPITQLDTQAIMARVKALQAERAASSGFVGGLQAAGKTIASTTGALASLAMPIVSFMGWTVAIAAATKAFQYFKKTAEDVRVALEGLTFKASATDDEKMSQLDQKLKDIADRKGELDRLAQDLVNRTYSMDVIWRVFSNADTEGNLQSQEIALKLQKAELLVKQKLIDKEKEATEQSEEKKIIDLEEQERLKKMTTVTISGNMRGDMLKYETLMKNIADSTKSALEAGREEAEKLGIPFEQLEKTILANASERMNELFKDIQKLNPEMAKLMEMKMPGLALMDQTGVMGKIIDGSELANAKLTEMMDRFDNLAKYMDIPYDGFVPQLREQLKTLTPLSKEWQKVKDAIKSAEDAQKAYNDQMAGKTEDVLGRLKAAMEKGFISPKEMMSSIQSSMPTITSDIERDLGDQLAGLDLTDMQRQAVFLEELDRRMINLGLSAIKAGKDTRAYGADAEFTSRALQAMGISAEEATRKWGPKKNWEVKGTVLDLPRNASKAAFKDVAIMTDSVEDMVKNVEALNRETERTRLEPPEGQAILQGLDSTWDDAKKRVQELGSLSSQIFTPIAEGVSKSFTAIEQRSRAIGSAIGGSVEAGLVKASASIAKTLDGEAISAKLNTAIDSAITRVNVMGDTLSTVTGRGAANFERMSIEAEKIKEALSGGIEINIPSAAMNPILQTPNVPIVTLSQALAAETLTVQSLIRTNDQLIQRMTALESVISAKDFAAKNYEIEMNNTFNTSQPVAQIAKQLQEYSNSPQ
jgi:hypothetical protein